LFSRRPGALYELPNRHGVAAVAIPTTELTSDELTKLLMFRLGQYLAIGFADARVAYDSRMTHEPLSEVCDDDVHVVAGSAADGGILCYIALRAVRPALRDARMRSRVRPLFPVEQAHGAGVYDPLPAIANLSATSVRELGRFIKNQRLHAFDEIGARATVELVLATVRTVTGPLRGIIAALIGDVEEGVANRNLDFFHVPNVLLHGTIGYEDETSFVAARYAYRAVYPFATLCSDLFPSTLERAEVIENALSLPGKHGLLKLLELGRDVRPPESSLETRQALPALTTTRVPHEDMSMAQRAALRHAGDRLRETNPFQHLSPAEATVLRTFMTERRVQAGETVVRRGEVGDTFYIIESGELDVHIGDDLTRPVARLSSGECFGEIAIVLSTARTADVIARTPSTLLKLSKEAYERFLRQTTTVDPDLLRMAVDRLARAGG
jgi:hypothetical protein